MPIVTRMGMGTRFRRDGIGHFGDRSRGWWRALAPVSMPGSLSSVGPVLKAPGNDSTRNTGAWRHETVGITEQMLDIDKDVSSAFYFLKTPHSPLYWLRVPSENICIAWVPLHTNAERAIICPD